jgi:hypothetical protein
MGTAIDGGEKENYSAIHRHSHGERMHHQMRLDYEGIVLENSLIT